jgi:hypothetical protein
MSDAASLRDLLARVDGTAPSIHAAAGGMMRHYDRSAGVAVNEWRNALQTARPQMLLSLLYVANEVLQNSKRNRGNKFLEAMSPVLGQALQHICRTDPGNTEKVRRTVKIWADRRVFSVRYVNELLQGLESFRNRNVSQDPQQQQQGPAFSPASPDETTPAPTNQDAGNDTSDDDDIMNILEDNERLSDSDDDGPVFGNNDESEEQKLELDINIDSSAFNNSAPRAATKRRRGNATINGSTSRRRMALSIGNLLEIWNRLSALQQSFDRAQMTLKQIDQSIDSKDASELACLVGDELQKEFRQNTQQRQQIQVQRRVLHEIAQERYCLEQEAMRYLSWQELLIKQDEDDLETCDRLEQKILSFQKIQMEIRKARDIRREEERIKREKEEEEERQRREKEESEKFRQAALQRQTEEKPGYVLTACECEFVGANASVHLTLVFSLQNGLESGCT